MRLPSSPLTTCTKIYKGDKEIHRSIYRPPGDGQVVPRRQNRQACGSLAGRAAVSTGQRQTERAISGGN
ncbi:hypothetical protein E2C01_072866 [Portunus trituberculatus]|uniref:Uncharacterized protein n=1 Tax=Portunus trituberculatus TaxID=210409 RepID=A0A5B7I3P8_PORTR|nr:hypothetical protein [Portunus trituberculatus]